MENTKKTLSTLIFTLFFSLLLFNCKDPKGQQPEEEPKPETVDRPSEIIEVDIARQQYLTYEKRRVDLIQKYEDTVDGYYDKDGKPQQEGDQKTEGDPNDPNGERFDVARYVYWDYATIKNYLKYIEKEAHDANVEISTLRFYFSNYDENSKNVHPRQNSLMITPTLLKNDREYIFEINDSNPENLKPLLLSDSFVPIKTQKKGMGVIYDDGQRSHAALIPNTTGTNLTVAPLYQGRSVTMNKGNSAPPPHHEN